MGVRGTEFLVQYYGSHLDLRVIEGIIETRINVGRNGEITGLGAADASSQYVQLRALEQISFSEGDIASTIPTAIRPFSIEGLPVPLLDRLAEIHKESPDSIPTEIMSGLDNARQEAINQLQKINNDSDLANDDLSFKTPSPSTTITETASPSHVATTASTASGSGGSSSSSGGSSSTKPKAEFRVHYGNDEILNNATITYPYTAGQTGEIRLELIPVKEELYDEISYEVSSSASSVASALADENPIYVNIEAVGETILTIKGKADGYQDYVKTVKLVVVDAEKIADFYITDNGAELAANEADYDYEIQIEGNKTLRVESLYGLENLVLSYESSNVSVIKINPSYDYFDLIIETGVTTGEAVITVTNSLDNYTAEKTIYVIVGDTSTIEDAEFKIYYGEDEISKDNDGNFIIYIDSQEDSQSIELTFESEIELISYELIELICDGEVVEDSTDYILEIGVEKTTITFGENTTLLNKILEIKIKAFASNYNEVEKLIILIFPVG